MPQQRFEVGDVVEVSSRRSSRWGQRFEISSLPTLYWRGLSTRDRARMAAGYSVAEPMAYHVREMFGSIGTVYSNYRPQDHMLRLVSRPNGAIPRAQTRFHKFEKRVAEVQNAPG